MHIQEPTGPPPEIRHLFLALIKIMQSLKPEYYEEPLITHDLNVTWDNIENELRGKNGRSGISRDSEWYREKTFQRLLHNIYVLDKQKLLLFIDDVLMQIPKVNILKPYLDDLKLRLNALNYDNQSIEKIRVFK